VQAQDGSVTRGRIEILNIAGYGSYGATGGLRVELILSSSTAHGRIPVHYPAGKRGRLYSKRAQTGLVHGFFWFKMR